MRIFSANTKLLVIVCKQSLWWSSVSVRFGKVVFRYDKKIVTSCYVSTLAACSDLTRKSTNTPINGHPPTPAARHHKPELQHTPVGFWKGMVYIMATNGLSSVTICGLLPKCSLIALSRSCGTMPSSSRAIRYRHYKWNSNIIVRYSQFQLTVLLKQLIKHSKEQLITQHRFGCHTASFIRIEKDIMTVEIWLLGKY